MRTITVTGHGISRVAPDVAVVHVAAVHDSSALPDALAGAESARASMVAVARRFTDEVASQSVSVGPEWTDTRRQRFRARHALLIRCADLDRAGELVSALAEEVGERLEVDHVGLEVSDPAEAARLAREAALADARAKAEHLADRVDCRLGPVVSIAEGGAQVPGPMLASLSKVAFEAGETTVGQALTLTWELVDREG